MVSVALALACDVQAGETSSPEPKPANLTFADWWDGKYATGNWFGVRDTLEDHGLGNVLWNVDGGRQQRFGYDDEWKFWAISILPDSRDGTRCRALR
ncbi:MAG: hypothetical protein WAM53_14725 [Terrimicrobiaceae bacterium]